jgi:hypothetical protein
MPLIAVILPYAISIRDFVHTGVLDELLSIADARIQIYTQNPDLPELDTIRSERVAIVEVNRYHSGRIESVLKRLYPALFYDIFVHVQQSVDRGTRHRRWLVKLLVGMRRLLGTSATLRLYAWLLIRVSRSSDQHRIEGTPDLVISTRSLINSLDYGLILEATKRRLPQLTAASSWDNFTTKGFFPFPVMKTIVWNRQMANELESIFGVAPDDIVIAGYPRVTLLEFTGEIDSAQAYLRKIGLGQYRRFVLHTASYAELTRSAPGEPPREYQMIREVAAALLASLPLDTCILVRLHPYSDAEDEAVFAGLDRLHVHVPGRQDRYVERVMSREDEVHLAAQLKFSECIVSMASTITIDALSLGRPIINVAFEPVGADPSSRVLRRFYKFNHFRDLIAAVKPPLATDVEQVVQFVERCMAGVQESEADMAAFERFYVPRQSTDYPRIVRTTVERLLDAGA